MIRAGCVLLTLVFWIPVARAGAEPVTFRVLDPLGRNVVMFESRAAMETIVGTTNRVSGTVRVDPEDVLSSTAAEFEVDLTALDTGIPRRNRDMREQYLETDRFPKIRFRLDRVVEAGQARLPDGQPVPVRAVGTVHLHGATRQEEVALRVTYFREGERTRVRLPGNLLRIEGRFDLQLKDYNIPIPKLVVMRLDNRISVAVDIFATDAPPSALAKLNPCNPCGGNPCNPCNPCNSGGGGKVNPCGGAK